MLYIPYEKGNNKKEIRLLSEIDGRYELHIQYLKSSKNFLIDTRYGNTIRSDFFKKGSEKTTIIPKVLLNLNSEIDFEVFISCGNNIVCLFYSKGLNTNKEIKLTDKIKIPKNLKNISGVQLEKDKNNKSFFINNCVAVKNASFKIKKKLYLGTKNNENVYLKEGTYQKIFFDIFKDNFSEESDNEKHEDTGESDNKKGFCAYDEKGEKFNKNCFIYIDKNQDKNETCTCCPYLKC